MRTTCCSSYSVGGAAHNPSAASPTMPEPPSVSKTWTRLALSGTCQTGFAPGPRSIHTTPTSLTGSRLGVQPKGVAGPDDPLREPVVGEVEDRRRCCGSGRDEVQLRRTGLAGGRDPKPLIVVGEDRVPDLGDPQPLKDGTRCGRDPHEVHTARVIPFVEPEVAAAVG
jgi:hypothetical protein